MNSSTRFGLPPQVMVLRFVLCEASGATAMVLKAEPGSQLYVRLRGEAKYRALSPEFPSGTEIRDASAVRGLDGLVCLGAVPAKPVGWNYECRFVPWDGSPSTVVAVTGPERSWISRLLGTSGEAGCFLAVVATMRVSPVRPGWSYAHYSARRVDVRSGQATELTDYLDTYF